MSELHFLSRILQIGPPPIPPPQKNTPKKKEVTEERVEKDCN